MPIAPYNKDVPLINGSDHIPTQNLKGKSVIITGGAQGIGKDFSTQLVAAGAFVTIGDVNVEAGKALSKELGPNAQFIKCDTTSWEESVDMFELAYNNSPHKSVDIVVANAGLGGMYGDPFSTWEDPQTTPKEKPNFAILNVNAIGAAYTAKLAFHYTRRQPEAEDRDRALIVVSSVAGYTDIIGGISYAITKAGLRGLLKTARNTVHSHGIRVGLIAPAFIRTTIRTEEQTVRLDKAGADYADVSDVTKCLMILASNKSLNGERTFPDPPSLISKWKKNRGRSLAAVPHSWDPSGVVDLKEDDEVRTGGYLEKVQDFFFDYGRALGKDVSLPLAKLVSLPERVCLDVAR
ncbi:hypothetical protein Plec18170_001361 [Paecilomyces lecythidis]